MIPPEKKIRVLVVDDSLLARTLIIKGLSAHPRIEIAGYAINALEAKKQLTILNPDVITLDVEMPAMSGFDFLKRYLPSHPVPVVLVSSLSLKVFDALAAGAVDFVRKPDEHLGVDRFLSALTKKVIMAANAKVYRAPAASSPPPGHASPLLGSSPALDRTLIGLGASTGGTEATLQVLQRLPKDTPPVVIVQHMPPGFTQMYAQRLDRLCPMEVREARHGDELYRGLALVAPAGLQARVIRSGSKYMLSCQPGEKISGHCPSVDALFYSMAEVVTSPMVGVIMTGMGQDGAAGLLSMRKKGAYTIGQDKESSVVYGMPMVAYNIGAVQIQAPCDHIAGVLFCHLSALR